MSRRGRYLPPVALDALIAEAGFEEFHDMLTGMGFQLRSPARPYQHRNRDVSFRFVWRRREPGITSSVVRSIRVTPTRKS